MKKTSNVFILAALLYFCNGLVSLVYGHSLVFGPEFFSSESGKPQRVVKRFSVHDVNQKFFVSVQNGISSEQKVAKGTVSINGELIATPDELGKQFKILTKPITLQKENDISVEVTGEAGASLIVTIMSLENRTVTATIPPVGDAVDLDGYASVIFPAGTFDATQKVTISVTTSPSIQDVFEAHATGPRLPYEIRINTDAGRARRPLIVVEKGKSKLTKEIADKVSKSREVVANAIRLLGLPKDIRDSLRSGKLSRAHARALLSFSDESKQREMYQQILAGGVSSKEVESIASRTSAKSSKTERKFYELEKNLAETLKTPVLIHSTDKGGKIIIRFATLQDLNQIAKSIID